MKKQVFLFLLTVAFSVAVFAQIQSQVVEGPISCNAFSYYLPKTAFKVMVTTKTTYEKPGIYARYSERQLGISDIITSEKVSKELLAVELSSYTVADKQRVFCIQASSDQSQSKKSKTNQAPPLSLQFSPEGVLTAVNMEASGAKIHPYPVSQQVDVTCTENDTDLSACMITSIHTQDMQLSGSSIRMAELAAKQIFEIRETRLSLLQGELSNMPRDGASFNKMLTELNRMELYYTELFTGSRQEITHTEVIDYTPEKIPSYEILFRFSSQKGLVDKDDLSGYPVHFLVHSPETDQITQQTEDTDETKANAPTGYGLYYYKPNMVGISILKGQQFLVRDYLTVAQFGDLMHLPAGEHFMVELDPNTGGILRYKN